MSLVIPVGKPSIATRESRCAECKRKIRIGERMVSAQIHSSTTTSMRWDSIHSECPRVVKYCLKTKKKASAIWKLTVDGDPGHRWLLFDQIITLLEGKYEDYGLTIRVLKGTGDSTVLTLDEALAP
jgi:hypothetical protein